MVDSILYPSCRFCDLSADPADSHCMNCGGSLDEEQDDSLDIMLALTMRLRKAFAEKTNGYFDDRRDLMMNITAGSFCGLWMFGCLIFVNLQPFDLPGVDAQEPSIQAAVEAK